MSSSEDSDAREEVAPPNKNELIRTTLTNLNQFAAERKMRAAQLSMITTQQNEFKKALFDQIRNRLGDMVLSRAYDNSDVEEAVRDSIKQLGSFANQRQSELLKNSNSPRDTNNLSPLEQLSSFKHLRDSMSAEERKSFDQDIVASYIEEQMKLGNYKPDYMNQVEDLEENVEEEKDQTPINSSLVNQLYSSGIGLRETADFPGRKIPQLRDTFQRGVNKYSNLLIIQRHIKELNDEIIHV